MAPKAQAPGQVKVKAAAAAPAKVGKATAGSAAIPAAKPKPAAQAPTAVTSTPESLLQTVLAGDAGAITSQLQAGGTAHLGTAIDGRTPLMHLIGAARLGEALKLLDLGDCGVNVAGADGRTALLMLAPGSPQVSIASPGAAALLAQLLGAGASPDVVDPETGETPLTWILSQLPGELTPLAKQLVAKSKNVNLCNKARSTPVDVAAAKLQVEFVDMLISKGADLSTNGQRLLEAALQDKEDALAAVLVAAAPQDAVKKAAGGLSFASLVAQGLSASALAFVQRFDSGRLSDSAVDVDGNTLLHTTAETGGPYDLILGLAKLGLGPNTTNAAGDTPLHVAARAGHVHVCQALVDGGADVLKRNSKNRRAKELPKISDAVKDCLLAAEEAAKERKANKQSELWDDKMRATQTESAFGLRCL